MGIDAVARFYSDPTPGFVFTGIVMAVLIAWVVGIAVYNFGPPAKRRAAAAAASRPDGQQGDGSAISLP